MSRILIVEDNPDLAFGLRRTLEFEGYEAEVAEDGTEGLARAKSWDPDLILLDLMLPGASGFEILGALRKEGSLVPVIVLTARGEEADVVLGFDTGADDYVTKPFSTVELLARVRAQLRRGAASTDGDGGSLNARWKFGDVEVDEPSRTVRKAGDVVALTPKEFDLLVALLRRGGAVASRSDLLSEVWEYPNAEVATRTVDIHVAELRRKLEEDPANPSFLLTVRKAGYRLEF